MIKESMSKKHSLMQTLMFVFGVLAMFPFTVHAEDYGTCYVSISTSSTVYDAGYYAWHSFPSGCPSGSRAYSGTLTGDATRGRVFCSTGNISASYAAYTQTYSNGCVCVQVQCAGGNSVSISGGGGSVHYSSSSQARSSSSVRSSSSARSSSSIAPFYVDSWPEYITDVKVIGGVKSTTDSLTSYYEKQGWIRINQDLNAGASGDYIYLLYRKGSRLNPKDGYITDFIVSTTNSSSISSGGRTYYRASRDGDDHFKTYGGNLNSYTKKNSTDMWLYYTKENYSDKRAVSGIYFNSSSSGAVSGKDLNEGAGGDYIYMHLRMTTKENNLKSDPKLATGLVYNGEPQRLIVSPADVWGGSMSYTCSNDIDYSVSSQSISNIKPVDAGKYRCCYYASSTDYARASDSKCHEVTISKAPNNNLSVGIASNLVYGDVLTPYIIGTNLSSYSGVYQYSTSKNGTYSTQKPTAVGTYWVRAYIDGGVNCNSVTTASKQFTISPKSIGYASIQTIPAQSYTGSAICPSVVVKDGATQLVSGKDYKVECFENVQVGQKSYAKISGLGNYTGEIYKSFEIVPDVLAQYSAIRIFKDQDGTHAVIDGSYGASADEPEAVSIPADIEVNSVEMTREFPTGSDNAFSTTVLPFDVNTANVSGLRAVLRYNGIKNGSTISMKVLWAEKGYIKNKDGSDKEYEHAQMAANTPYLVLMKNSEFKLKSEAYPITLKQTAPANTEIEGCNWVFHGTWKYKKWGSSCSTGKQDCDKETGFAYGFAASASEDNKIDVGTFVKVGEGAWIRPMRAYLVHKDKLQTLQFARANGAYVKRPTVLPEELPELMSIVIDGDGDENETTVIGQFNTRTGEFKMNYDRGKFDLKGRRVNSEKPNARGAFYGKKVLKK